jgi:hypothetical protein
MSNGSKSRNSLVSFVRNYREEARQESMKQRRKQAFQPMLDDKLEDRRLMTITASINASKLTVLMDTVDTVELTYSGAQLRIPGVAITNATSPFTSIDFTLNNATASGTPAVVFSGSNLIQGTNNNNLTSITTTNSGASGWIFRLNQKVDLVSATVNTNATTVTTTSPGSIGQSVMNLLILQRI